MFLFILSSAVSAGINLGLSDCQMSYVDRRQEPLVRAYFDGVELTHEAGDISSLIVTGGENLPPLTSGLEQIASLSLQSPKWNINGADEKFVSSLKNLRYLFVFNNALESIISLDDLLYDNNLCSLSIRSDGLNVVSIKGMTSSLNLERLVLYCRNLEEMDSSVVYLTSLQDLIIIGGKLDHLPGGLHELSCLRFLSIIGNRLDLEEEFLFPPHLRALYLPRNRLTEFPDGIRELRNLREIDFSHNPISEIPEWITDLKELEGLFLRSSEIDEVPLFLLELPNIKQIDLMGSKVRQAPPEFKRWIEEGKLLIGN